MNYYYYQLSVSVSAISHLLVSVQLAACWNRCWVVSVPVPTYSTYLPTSTYLHEISSSKEYLSILSALVLNICVNILLTYYPPLLMRQKRVIYRFNPPIGITSHDVIFQYRHISHLCTAVMTS